MYVKTDFPKIKIATQTFSWYCVIPNIFLKQEANAKLKINLTMLSMLKVNSVKENPWNCENPLVKKYIDKNMSYKLFSPSE